MSNFKPYPIQLPYNGKKFNVLFLMTCFVAPFAQREPVDVEVLGEKDKALIDAWTKANGEKREAIEEKFSLTKVVGPFIDSAYPDGAEVKASKGTRIFRILTDAEYAEAALPPKAELDVQLREKEESLTAAEERIKALEAELSAANKSNQSTK